MAMATVVAPKLDTENYRDHLSNVTDNGGRIWIYPRIIKGFFYNLRSYLSYFLIAGLLAGPFLEWNGHPIFMFHVLDRKFILFGIPFFPQDFNILALALLTFVLFIVLFTVAFGRAWCGWACPQTVFMEMLFRKIENWIEGDYKKQQRLKEAPWTTDKIIKKTAKHAIFFLLSFGIANAFLAYLIGKADLLALMTEGPIEHWGKFASLMIFTIAFYLVFAKFRELVCIYVCPYGRLQSVLVDNNTVSVAYDYIRGEPRGKDKSSSAQGVKHGSCVDCGLCVQVCPTGIDIRNGSQLECINCTACIDACNMVMDKIHKPEGLIRYASKNGIEQGEKLTFSIRMASYLSVLAILAGFMVYLLVSRPDLEATILRAPGMMFQEQKNGSLTNLYNFELVNKTFDDMKVQLKVKNPTAKLNMIGTDANVPQGEILKGAFFIEINQKDIHINKIPLEVEVYSNGKLIETVKTSFMGKVI
jgi:cytochrome c oxidase accessory protein FixG